MQVLGEGNCGEVTNRGEAACDSRQLSRWQVEVVTKIRTRVKMLIKLGVRRDEAISHGCSGRGTWVMSSSAAVHVALNIDYLSKEGLANLEAIWSKLASKNRTAGCGPACPVV